MEKDADSLIKSLEFHDFSKILAGREAGSFLENEKLNLVQLTENGAWARCGQLPQGVEFDDRSLEASH